MVPHVSISCYAMLAIPAGRATDVSGWVFA